MILRACMWAAVLSALLLTGCPKTGGPLKQGKVATAQQYLALQRARGVPESLRVRGNARIIWKQRGIRIRTGLRLLLDAPDSLRTEVLIAGRPQVQVAMSSNSVDAYLRFARLFAHGDEPDILFEQFSEGMLSRHTFLDLLVGRLPDFEGWSGIAEREPGTGLVRLDLEHPEGARATLWMWEDGYEPQRLIGRVPEIEGIAYALGFDDYREVGRHRLPHLVTVEIPSQELTVELEYKDVETGIEVSAEAFRLEVPEGSRVASLEEVLREALGPAPGVDPEGPRPEPAPIEEPAPAPEEDTP